MDKKIKVIGNAKKGYSLFAGRHFWRGQKIVTFEGRLTAQKTRYSIQIAWDRNLEPRTPYKYINHSCWPNTFFKLKRGKVRAFAKIKYPDCCTEPAFTLAERRSWWTCYSVTTPYSLQLQSHSKGRGVDY